MTDEKKGTTTVGIIANNCVVLAAESKATLGNLVSSKEAKKVFQLDDKIVVTISGSVGDAQQLIRIMQAELSLYKMENGDSNASAAITLMSNIMQSSRYYPYITMMIMGGIDSEGYHLFNIDPMGGVTEDKYTSTGSGSPVAFGVLESGFKENLSRDEAVSLAVRSIRAAKERDVYTGGKRIDIAVITEKGVEFSSEQ
jgi:proteasome beta subunit